MESASQFAVITHLHIDALVKTESDQIERLFHCIHWRWLQSEYCALPLDTTTLVGCIIV